MPPRAPRLVLALAIAGAAVGASAEPLEVGATAVALGQPEAPLESVGALTFRGGLTLGSPDSRLGGLSGIDIEPGPGGPRLLAVTDRGDAIALRLVLDAGRLTGVADGEVWPLADPSGRPLGSGLRDSESLASLPGGGHVVGFERRHRLWRYPAGIAPPAKAPVPVPPPPGAAHARYNGGFEAVTALADGRLLALLEVAVDDAPPGAWIGPDRNGRWQAVAWPRDGGYHPSGAATLPDGDIVLLEREIVVAGLVHRARLWRVDGRALAAGRVSRRPLASFGSEHGVDNLEGVAGLLGPAGETLLLLVSDDNFFPLQRTLLLLFAVAPTE